MMITTPAPYIQNYLRLVPETDLLRAMQIQLDELDNFLRSIPDDQLGKTHPPYTWKIRQVIIHVLDAERIFAYRALRFARADTTPLPGFDENEFATQTLDDTRSSTELADDFNAVRTANIHLIKSFPPDAWTRRGQANSFDWSVADLIRAMLGHARHHEQIVRKRLKS